MKLKITNQVTGRSTDYDSRYLQAEARRIVKGRGKFREFYVLIDDKHGLPTLVAYYAQGEKIGSVTQSL